MEVRIEIGKCRNFKMEKKNGAKQDETETLEIFICSGGAWHDAGAGIAPRKKAAARHAGEILLTAVRDIAELYKAYAR